MEERRIAYVALSRAGAAYLSHVAVAPSGEAAALSPSSRSCRRCSSAWPCMVPGVLRPTR